MIVELATNNSVLNVPDEQIDQVQEMEEVKAVDLTDWKNPPSISDLKQDLTDAQSDHDIYEQRISDWLDNLNVEGKAKPKKIKGKSRVQPMVIRKQAEWRYASLTEPFLSTEDIFNTRPITFEDKEAAIQNGLVLNKQFNTELNKIAFFDEYVRAATDEGTAIVRVGWRYEERIIQVPNMIPMPIQDPQQAQQIMQIAQQLQQAPDDLEELTSQVGEQMVQSAQLSLQTGQPVGLIQQGMKDETEVVHNGPTLEVCNYQDVIVDPTCQGDLRKAEFVIYQFETNLSALEKDGRYSNLKVINVEQSASTIGERGTYDDPSFTFNDKPRKKFVVQEYWGYWDFNDTGIAEPFVAAWVGSTMIRLEENPFPDKDLPFVSVQYLPVRKSIYGEPDGHLLEDNQKIIGAVTRGMIDIMARTANGQQIMRKDAFDVTNKRKYARGEDAEINPAVDIKQAVQTTVFPEIPQSAATMLELQNFEAESITGVKSFSQGISGQALGATATGIRSALDATAKRELGILRRLAEGVKQIGRKITSMNTEFLSEDEVVRITNEEFVPIRRDNLKGDIDIELTISTAEADNDKAQELAFMLQTTGQTMGPQFSQLILENIARLRKMPDLAQAIKEFKPPPPDPMEEQMKQLELAKLQAEVAKLQSEAAENQTDGELNQAKVQETLAKARAIGSGADKTDLDFVEQEDGVTQERDLEKAKAQSQGNMQLKAMEAALKLKEKGMDFDAEQQNKATDHEYNLREKDADAKIERAKPKTT